MLLADWSEDCSRSGERPWRDRMHRREAGWEGGRHHWEGRLCSDQGHRRYAAHRFYASMSWNVVTDILVHACASQSVVEIRTLVKYKVLSRVSFTDNVKDWSKVVLAYEPVWAIGTGKTASPQQVNIRNHWIFNLLCLQPATQCHLCNISGSGSSW